MVQSVFVVTSKGPSIQSYKQSNTYFLGLRIYLLTVVGGEKFSGKKLHLVVQNWQGYWATSKKLSWLSISTERSGQISTTQLGMAHNTLAKNPFGFCWTIPWSNVSHHSGCPLEVTASWNHAINDIAQTIERPRTLFARYRVPAQLVTDNGPQFTSAELPQPHSTLLPTV